MKLSDQEFKMLLLENENNDLELKKYKISKEKKLLEAKIEKLKELFTQSSSLNRKYQDENTELKNNIEILDNKINSLPKLIQRIFIKDYGKNLLK